MERHQLSSASAEDQAFLERLRLSQRLHPVESLDSFTADQLDLGLLADVGGLVCPADRYLQASARIAAALEIPYLPETAAITFRDKRLQRTRAVELGLPAPSWASAREAQDVRRFCRSVDGPWVIKNVAGTGSQDTVLATTMTEAVETFQYITSRSRYMNADLMIEAFVASPVVSLEGFVVGERFATLGLTDRTFGPRPYFAETGWGFPLDEPTLLERTADIARTVLTALKVERSAFHFEFLVREEQPILMDANCRLPGAMIMPLLQYLSRGSYYGFLLDSALGRTVPTPTFDDYGAMVKRYTETEGTLRRAGRVASAAKLPGVLEVIPVARPGARVQPARDYAGALHWVLARGDKLDAAKSNAQAASDHLMAAVHVGVADE
ncbi:hypothetical protein ABZ820_41025 [Streptomyces diacarni]|uniref:ATP-grasp domain-containing protein n=1 Tax=Streptomyces diacarni TaxID=2800381 RepID=UPI0033C400FB